MRLSLTEVIILAIKIGRDDTLKSDLLVFLVVEPALDFTHPLRHSVSLIRVMRRSVVKPLFLDRVKWDFVRINTSRKNANQSFNFYLIARFDHIKVDHHVLFIECNFIGHVCEQTSNSRC